MFWSATFMSVAFFSSFSVHAAGKTSENKSKGLTLAAGPGSEYPEDPNAVGNRTSGGREPAETVGVLSGSTEMTPGLGSATDDEPLPLFWRLVSFFWADHLQEVAIGVFLCLLTVCYRGLFSCCHRRHSTISESSFQPPALAAGVGPAGRGGTTVLLAKNPPRCPECGSRMILRTSGETHHFCWGCAGFRRAGSGHCAGTRNATVYSVLHVL